jgi:hypothetical protein
MVGLEAALDRFCEVADGRRFGIEGVHVVADGRRFVERRWIADIRRDAFSVSKTVTSLAVGMLAHDGLLTLDDPVLMHLPQLADTAAAIGLRRGEALGIRWADVDLVNGTGNYLKGTFTRGDRSCPARCENRIVCGIGAVA